MKNVFVTIGFIGTGIYLVHKFLSPLGGKNSEKMRPETFETNEDNRRKIQAAKSYHDIE